MTAKVKTICKSFNKTNKSIIISKIGIILMPLTALSSWRLHMPGSTKQTLRGCRQSQQYLFLSLLPHSYRKGTQRKRLPAAEGWRRRRGRRQALTRDCCSWKFWGFSMCRRASQCLRHSWCTACSTRNRESPSSSHQYCTANWRIQKQRCTRSPGRGKNYRYPMCQ